MIDNNILAVSNVMFKDKKDWNKVSLDQKEQFFFIFNRYFSKRHLDKSFLLNHKDIDKSTSMELWFEYYKDKSYPKWFWSKSPKQESNETISEKDLLLLKKHLDLGDNELSFLIKHHRAEIIEEIEYLKKLTK